FNRRWEREVDDAKFLVFQSRMTWAAAANSEVLNNRKDELIEYSRHGVNCLDECFFDSEFGGYCWLSLGREQSHPLRSGPKRLYGLAFALFALSRAARSLNDKSIGSRATALSDWIESHLHDFENGGYFEFCDRKGAVLPSDEFAKEARSQKTLNTQ